MSRIYSEPEPGAEPASAPQAEVTGDQEIVQLQRPFCGGFQAGPPVHCGQLIGQPAKVLSESPPGKIALGMNEAYGLGLACDSDYTGGVINDNLVTRSGKANKAVVASALEKGASFTDQPDPSENINDKQHGEPLTSEDKEARTRRLKNVDQVCFDALRYVVDYDDEKAWHEMMLLEGEEVLHCVRAVSMQGMPGTPEGQTLVGNGMVLLTRRPNPTVATDGDLEAGPKYLHRLSFIMSSGSACFTAYERWGVQKLCCDCFLLGEEEHGEYKSEQTFALTSSSVDIEGDAWQAWYPKLYNSMLILQASMHTEDIATHASRMKHGYASNKCLVCLAVLALLIVSIILVVLLIDMIQSMQDDEEETRLHFVWFLVFLIVVGAVVISCCFCRRRKEKPQGGEWGPHTVSRQATLEDQLRTVLSENAQKTETKFPDLPNRECAEECTLMVKMLRTIHLVYRDNLKGGKIRHAYVVLDPAEAVRNGFKLSTTLHSLKLPTTLGTIPAESSSSSSALKGQTLFVNYQSTLGRGVDAKLFAMVAAIAKTSCCCVLILVIILASSARGGSDADTA